MDVGNINKTKLLVSVISNAEMEKDSLEGILILSFNSNPKNWLDVADWMSRNDMKGIKA